MLIVCIRFDTFHLSYLNAMNMKEHDIVVYLLCLPHDSNVSHGLLFHFSTTKNHPHP